MGASSDVDEDYRLFDIIRGVRAELVKRMAQLERAIYFMKDAKHRRAIVAKRCLSIPSRITPEFSGRIGKPPGKAAGWHECPPYGLGRRRSARPALTITVKERA